MKTKIVSLSKNEDFKSLLTGKKSTACEVKRHGEAIVMY